VIAVATLYPDVHFACYGATKFLNNSAGYNIYGYQSAYLAGMLGAGITKTGKIGFQGAFGYPYEYASVHALEAGAAKVNPSVVVVKSWVGDWVDVSKGYENAMGMIDSGVDFIETSASGPGLGAIKACSEHNAYAIAMFTNQTDVAPDAVIASIVFRSYYVVMDMVNDIKAGTFKGRIYKCDMASKSIDFVINPSLRSRIPTAILDKIEKTRQDIINGVIEVPYYPYA
jgi:basic membrane protein A